MPHKTSSHSCIKIKTSVLPLESKWMSVSHCCNVLSHVPEIFSQATHRLIYQLPVKQSEVQGKAEVKQDVPISLTLGDLSGIFICLMGWCCGSRALLFPVSYTTGCIPLCVNDGSNPYCAHSLFCHGRTTISVLAVILEEKNMLCTIRHDHPNQHVS